jgi:hypothetical protein
MAATVVPKPNVIPYHIANFIDGGEHVELVIDYNVDMVAAAETCMQRSGSRTS